MSRTQTIERMQSDNDYPDFNDWLSSSIWEELGHIDISELARKYVEETLVKHYLDQYDLAWDEQIQERFSIILPRRYMKPASGRWLTPSPGG